MDRYDKLVAELQRIITAEELEIDLIRMHADGIAASTAVAIRSEFVAKLKALVEDGRSSGS